MLNVEDNWIEKIMIKLKSLYINLFLLLLFVHLNQCYRAPKRIPGVGAEENPSGEPVGGGNGYRQLFNRGDHYVTDRAGLLVALKMAKPHEMIYVDSAAVIDLTGLDSLCIPGGVTLAGSRGKNGSKGALLFTKKLDTPTLFITGGPDVRITGLRFAGPDTTRRTRQLKNLLKSGGREGYYSIPINDGIISHHSGLLIDNCEWYGWNHAAIFLKPGAWNAKIYHNYIHHCQREGLGYGVCLDKSSAIIEGNLFNWCRHAIAATGRPRTEYKARYNLVLEYANGHSFDMHGGADREDGTDIAGQKVLIHHNTFLATDVAAVVIRGRPLEVSKIHHNFFKHKSIDAAVKQTNFKGNLEVYDNFIASKYFGIF